jgi:putative oxidoreductase
MSTTSNKGLNIALWITQVLLAALYLMAGSTKLFQPIEEIVKMLPWVSETPAGLVRFIGLSELLGGIGLLLPAILRIQPKLTVFAAIGLTIVQVLAAGFHLSRGETAVIGMNFLLIAMAVFIAWGRTKKVPIAPK